MFATNEFRKGLKVDIDNVPYNIVDFQHVKPGKGNAFTRVRFKSLIDGRVLDQTLKSGDKVKAADTQERTMQYLYDEAGMAVFMDNSTYEQIQIEKDKLESEAPFLSENLEVRVLFFNGKAIGITLPTFVELRVKECDPGIRGDTVSGATKWATLETDLKVTVPLHISEGDLLKIDTREGGAYAEKVNK
jgi:elongation factor P